MTTSATPQLSSIVHAQLVSLDDTDCYASAWEDALQAAKASNRRPVVTWGGRGQGGRGTSRRTLQPHSVVLEDVRLEYVSDVGLPGKVLLQSGTKLKLLPRHVYSVVGRNGCGKSSLLRRIDAGKIPGFPPHLSTLYIPQEVLPPVHDDKSPLDVVLSYHKKYSQQADERNQTLLTQLEEQLEQLGMEEQEQMEDLCQQISNLEDEIVQGGYDVEVVRQQAEDALAFFGVDPSCWCVSSSMDTLSGGQRKKIFLSIAVFCRTDLLLLDEPTNFLDVEGLVQLRRLISMCADRNTTVVLVSHDVDLINDVATDVIHFHNQTLAYYPGNYRDFCAYKHQKDLSRLREHAALEKKRDAMLKTIEHLKKQPTPKRGGAKKKSRTIESARKKLEKQGIDRDEKGHRWKQQKAGTGIKEGSINAVDASTRSNLTHAQLLKRVETNVAPVPDKAVQFVFRNTTCTWGEPLIMAMDVGHGYGEMGNDSAAQVVAPSTQRREGFLFDCVDLCVNEGSIVCLLGANASGKSTLLRILAKREQPREGRVHHVTGLGIGYFDQHEVDRLIDMAADNNDDDDESETALSLLQTMFSLKTEQDIRGELTSFGLSPAQATTKLSFLSGGERCRLCLACLMLRDPQLLILDEPTSHLDVESVEALIYGLKQWNGTVVLVSHDAHLIRSLGDTTCHVIMPHEGKIRRVQGGIDSYLKAFQLS